MATRLFAVLLAAGIVTVPARAQEGRPADHPAGGRGQRAHAEQGFEQRAELLERLARVDSLARGAALSPEQLDAVRAELRELEDIDYMRQMLSLEMTDEQAAAKFEALIHECMKSKATRFNNVVHILAH